MRKDVIIQAFNASSDSAAAVFAKLGSAIVMGLAITGMHYTGMAAAQFAPGSICLAADSSGGLNPAMMATIIAAATVGILALTLVISAFDAQFAARTAKHAESLHAANEQLRNIALYDSLTGLPNRVLLDDRMAQAVAHAERRAKSFAVMFVDLDRFKPVNDAYGHRVGDELLKAAARRLAGCIRKEDTVARAGGDEFIVVLHEINGKKDAAGVGEKILAELARPFHLERHEVDISCSVGISVYPDDGRDIDTLMMNADVAMYRAKQSGRNNCQYFAPAGEVAAADGVQ